MECINLYGTFVKVFEQVLDILADMSLSERLFEFMVNEARSCSIVFECVTPEYVYSDVGEALQLKRLLTRWKM